MISVKNSLVIWSNTFLISAFPYLFFSSVMMYTNGFDFLVDTLGKIFSKLFKAPLISGYVFFMSVICGYPISATLVGDFVKRGIITREQGNKILTFSSHSSILFVVGVIGICKLDNLNMGLTIFFIHIISSVIVGALFRNFFTSKNDTSINILNNTENFINNSITATLKSTLLAGGYNIISSFLIDIVRDTKFFNLVTNTLSGLLDEDKKIIDSTFFGIMELTYGINELSALNIDKRVECTIICGLISFGGLGFFAESYYVCDVDKKVYFVSKVLHSIISVVLCLAVFRFLQ